MARTRYSGRGADTVLSRLLMGDGRIVVGVPASPGGTPAATTLTVWDAVDGTDVTDQCVELDGVTPLASLVIPAGEIQVPAFLGPDGWTADLWGRTVNGDWIRFEIGPQGPEGVPGEVTTAAMNTAIAAAIANLIDSAPGTLDTLNELAAALGDDPNFATTITNALAEKQPLDTDLTALAALVSAADKMPYATGSGTWSLADLTAFARSLLDDADAATARATLLAASSVGGGREKVAALSATTGTATGDLSTASIFTVTPTGDITLAFSNVPSAAVAERGTTVTVIVKQGATVRTVTPPAGTKWMGAAAPTQAANKACAFTFVTDDGGTTWYASAAVEQ